MEEGPHDRLAVAVVVTLDQLLRDEDRVAPHRLQHLHSFIHQGRTERRLGQCLSQRSFCLSACLCICVCLCYSCC